MHRLHNALQQLVAISTLLGKCRSAANVSWTPPNFPKNNTFSGLKFRVDLTLQDLSPQLLNIMQIVCKLVWNWYTMVSDVS